MCGVNVLFCFVLHGSKLDMFGSKPDIRKHHLELNELILKIISCSPKSNGVGINYYRSDKKNLLFVSTIT